MFKSVVRFFRKRAIRDFLLHRKACALPDISKYPTVAVFLEESQKSMYKELNKTMNQLFLMKRCTFIFYEEKLSADFIQNYKTCSVVKDDFNVLGIMKKDKKSFFDDLSFDMLINLSKSQPELLTYDYVLTCIRSSFRVRFGNSEQALYDLVIDSKKDDSLINQLEILQKYLLMLSGNNKNEN